MITFRHAHQVTLVALSKLKQEAYSLMVGDAPDSIISEWESQMKKRSPTFQFWDLIMKYQTLILIFVRAHRTKQFYLYIEVLEALVHLFFALDHINYARWIPIHLRDMKSLPASIEEKFKEGNWVISKTDNKFSAIPIDQAHEQENKNIKATGW